MAITDAARILQKNSFTRSSEAHTSSPQTSACASDACVIEKRPLVRISWYQCIVLDGTTSLLQEGTSRLMRPAD